VSKVQLAEVKAHCIIETNDDDAMLQSYIDAAEQRIQDYLRRDLDTDYPSDWPTPIVTSVMILVAAFYADREAASGNIIPVSVKGLLASYRVHS